MSTLAASANNSKAHHEPAARWWAAGSLFFALVAALPLFLNSGFLNTRGGGDSPFLLFRLHQLHAALMQGVFPVRWMPDAAFGLGYPFFNYYAALPYYFAAGLKAYGFSYVASLKLTQLLGFFAAAGGMYAWIRRATGSARAGFVAAAAYTFAPFHMVNVYVRGDSLSEFWAMAWYPLILLAVLETARQPSRRRIALLALAYGALAMTHNVSALIFSPFVAVYALVSVATNSATVGGEGSRHTYRLASVAAGGVLGLALAAWVWLPALAEKDFVQLDTQTTGYLFYGNHFRAANLVQPGFFFGYDPSSDVITPFSMGLLQAILILAGAAALTVWMVRRRTWWAGGFLLGGLTASTLMITPLSTPMWEHIPLLAFAQFPWRFLSVQALFGAAAIGWLVPGVFSQSPSPVERIPGRQRLGKQSWRIALPVGLSAVMAAAALGALRLDFIPLNDADVSPMRLQWYEAFSGNIGTTIRYEYLPKWTYPRPYTSDILLQREPRAKFLTGTGSARRTAAAAESQVWNVEVVDSGAQVAIPLLYWPGWRAEIDGRAAPITPVEGIGYIQLDVPPGDHTIHLWLGRTDVRLWAEIASAAALIVTLWSLRPDALRWDWVTRMLAAAGALVLIVPSMVLHSLPEPKPLPGPLNADFSQEAYFHHSPEGVLFGERFRLTHVEIIPGTFDFVVEGERYPSPNGPEVGQHAYLSPPVPHAQQGAPGMYFYFPITEWGLPPGLYAVRFSTFFPYAARTSSGQARSDVYVSPTVISSRPPSTPSQLIADLGPVRLRASEVTYSPWNSVRIMLIWESVQEMTQNYSIALRLRDETGIEWAALDTQAGATGMYPTGLWSPGEIVVDGYGLMLPVGMPPGSNYSLYITLYEAASLKPIADTVVIQNISYTRNEFYSCTLSPEQLTNEISIDRIVMAESAEQGNQLAIEVGWVAKSPQENYQIAWTLRLSTGEEWQTQTPLVPGSDPTTWLRSECGIFVLGRHHLDIPASLPPGNYSISLQVLSESGRLLGEPYIAGQAMITGRERNFEIPPLAASLDVRFGDQVRLWGYTLNQSPDSLTLDVVWGSLADPTQDYKYFVHLFDPATNEIVAQVDSMPRGYTYPTSQWIGGEVITEIITLDLRNVPPGAYRIAIGWYDPTTVIRLPAIDAAGATLPDGRVILPETIDIP